MQVATLVSGCWTPARTEGKNRQAFLLGAWERINARGVELTQHERRRLPRQPRRPTQAASPQRLSRTMTEAAERLAAAGYDHRHVPRLMLTVGEFLPPLHELRYRHQLATLLAHAMGRPSSDAEEPAPPRLGPTSTNMANPTPRDLAPYLDALLAEPPTDYEHARAALASLPRTPPHDARVPVGDWPLAAAWIWVHHTRGPLLAGVHRLRLNDLAAYHRPLTPDQRLHLHELGLAHLTWTDDLHTATTPAARPMPASEETAS